MYTFQKNNNKVMSVGIRPSLYSFLNEIQANIKI